MASMKLLLNQAGRHYLTKPPSHLRPYPFPSFSKSLSSQSNPESLPIQPVSYAIKPKDQTPPTETPPPPPPPPQDLTNSPTHEETQTTWTRAEIRYLKDAPSISPVSYPTRVAPLPEDRVAAAPSSGQGEDHEGAKEKDNGAEMGMERERRKIDSENRTRQRVFRIVEEGEKVKVPFPTLIKPKRKEKRVPLDLAEAIRLVKANAKRNFVETVEAHVRLDIAQKRSDLTVKGTAILPHGASKAVRLAVFAYGADADEARAAGADIVGGDELIEEIQRTKKINFERCLSTEKCMRSLIKISQILNTHGLMPDPRQGTVISDISRAVKEARRAHINFEMHKSIVHVGLGKVSFSEAALRENFGAFMNALLLAKPAGLKKASKYAGYVNSIHICSTMGPGFPVSIQSVSKAVDVYNKMLLN